MPPKRPPGRPRFARPVLAVALLATVVGATTLGAVLPVGDRGVPAGTAPVTRAADAHVVGPGDDAAGRTVATGEVNGDGVADLVVGAPASDAGGPDAGAVYVEFGPVRDGRLDLADADATLVGAAAGDRAGYDLAVDDLDGDGVDDLAVGAPGSDAGGPDAGAVYVVGGADPPSGTVDLATAGTVLTGDGAGDGAGWSVGTVARPGGADLLVGAPHSNVSAAEAGAVYRLDGTDLPDRANLSVADRTLVGASFGDKAGWSVAGAGDVDGDGRADVVVGAKSNDTAGQGAGVAYLVVSHGGGTAPLPTTGLALAGATPGEIAGFDVAGAGDVDGDGLADVLVGAPLADGGGENAGVAYLVRGSRSASGTRSLATAALVMHGESDLDRAGWSVAGGGDLLGCDGRPDPLVGATWQSAGGPGAGAVYVVSARADEVGSLGAATTELVGGRTGGRLGTGLAAGADLDADGAGDLVVAAPHATADGPGVVYVLDGDCPVASRASPTAASPTAASPTAASPTAASPTATHSPTVAPSPVATPSPTAASPATATPSQTPRAPRDSPPATPTRTATGTDPGPLSVAAVGGALAAAALLAVRRFG